ncbi:MAG: ATP-binding protein [Thermoproteota archaeon]
MNIGYVVGESKPTFVTALSSRPLSVGEYVIIDSEEGKILGLVEKSAVSSAAFADVRNFEEAAESTEIAEINSRDKTYTAHIGVFGFLDKLQRGQSIIPAIPPIPGTPILQPTREDLETIFCPTKDGWIKIGHLLRNKTIDAKVNLDKIVSRHLGILSMTGMGKSNLVSLLTKEIAKLRGTVIIFDYHNDYTSLNIPRINVVDAKINPRLLDHEQLSEVLEIRDSANVQQRILRMAFTNKVKESKEFWEKLEEEVEFIINAEDKKLKEYRTSAYRVQDIIDEAQRRFADILDPDMGDPLSFIKEGRANILNISELSEKQANVAVAFYLQQLLRDRKDASIARHGKLKRERSYRFESPIFVIIEEAHVFIPKEQDTSAKYWAAKIAREGRKFGLGLGIVSQRPRSVDLNVLSQMGSFAIMKIIQEDDQRQIASATESTSKELIGQLTSLNVGDSVLVGQWVNLPSLVHIEEVKEKIMGADQSAVRAWAKSEKMSEVAVESTQKLVQKDLLLD